MPPHPDATTREEPDGTWSVTLREVPVRTGLTRPEAEALAKRTPSEIVKGTLFAREWFGRGASVERITGEQVAATDVCDPIRSGRYTLDLFDLYARMWEIATDLGDGTRLFKPHPGGREALKWLIEELSGTPTDHIKTMRDNNAIRKAVHARLEERGWAERINQVSFRLLRDPDATPGDVPTPPARTDGQDADAAGEAIVDVTADQIVTEDGRLSLSGLDWSPWHPLATAAKYATTDPGVYVARSGNDIVYVGMAGERRGSGVRGRLQIYVRGRGAVSGLGEAALDRALADRVWLTDRITRLETDGASRAKEWAANALAHSDLHVCWTAAPDAETARDWERLVLLELEEVALWNRARPNK